MSVHFVKKCKHGFVLSQCRCTSPNKTVIIMSCPEDHASWDTGSGTDMEEAIAFMRRVIPIQHEPLATAVAEEWANKLLSEGWHK